MYDFTYLNGLTIEQLEDIHRWAHWRDDEHCQALAIETLKRILEMAA